MTTEPTRVRDAIAAERRELATLLGTLDDGQWDAPSLCAGWRVRETVAHMTMPFRLSRLGFLLELARARGNFDRMADRSARRDAANLSAGELAALMADNATHPWTPPGGGFEAALSHDVIHGLDVTVALGLDRRVPAGRLRIVLDAMSPRSVRYFGADLREIELRADDLDWRYGAGAPLRGAAQDLLLVVCGRKLPPGHLDGEPGARFTRAG